MKRILAALLLLLLTGCATAEAKLPISPMMKGYLAGRAGDYDGSAAFYREALAADPESVVLRLSLVKLHVAYDKLDEALDVLDEGLEQNPDHGEMTFLKAEILRLSGKNEQAADVAMHAARLGGGEKAYGLAVGLLMGLQRYEEAKTLSTEWTEQMPDHANAHFTQGLVLERLEQLEEAEAAYRRAFELDPNDATILQALARRVSHVGEPQEAIELYQRLIEANPHQTEARLSLAELLIDQGAEDEALVVLKEAQKWGGSNVHFRARVAVLYLQMNRHVEAEALLTGLSDPDKTGRLLFLLGVARLAQDNFEGALETFEQVGKDSPLYSEALPRRAIALAELERMEEAVQLLQQFVADNPDNVDVALTLASLLQEQEQVREAAELLTTLMEGAGSKDVRVYFSLGSLHDKLDEWERSVEIMEALLAIEPDHAHALNYIGYTWAEHGVNLEEAERVVRRALELLPENGAIIDSLGWALYKQGRYKEALVEMERAVERIEKDPIIWEHMGDVLIALEKKDKALEAYEKAFGFDPDNAGLAEKVEKLK